MTLYPYSLNEIKKTNSIQHIDTFELICKGLNNFGLDENLYFYRDSNNNEVDLLIDLRDILLPIEIKSSETFNKSFLKGIKCFFSDYKDKSKNGIVVYNGEYEQSLGNVEIINYLSLINKLKIFH